MISLFLSLFLANSFAFDPLSPHPHTGKVIPMKKAPEAVFLSRAQQQSLSAGKPIFMRVRTDDTQGKGVAVQYIQAPPEVVWNTILNYPKYPQWVENVKSCTVYQKNGESWYTSLISEVMFVEFGIYIHNRIRKEEGYMFWTLDYRRRSDADDLLGYWRLEQVQSDPPITRVDYSTELIIAGVPDFIVDYLSQDALINGTSWVKREAEKSTDLIFTGEE